MNSPQRILYVEDEPDIQAITRIALETLGGFTLEVCDTGMEALQKAGSFTPDLILLDVMMPGMDGPSTLRELRTLEATQATPVIFMTAKTQHHELDGYRALGALDVISKPFDPMQLADKIRTIWETCHDAD